MLVITVGTKKKNPLNKINDKINFINWRHIKTLKSMIMSLLLLLLLSQYHISTLYKGGLLVLILILFIRDLYV